MGAVNRLDSVELVLVTTKWRKNPTYQFCYFQKSEAVDGVSAYVTSPEDFKNSTSYKSALFLKYKKNKHSFYRANCFREKLKRNERLRNVLEQEM